MGRFILRTPIKYKDLYFDRPNDVSSWNNLGTEPGGAREKLVIQHPKTKKIFLLKFPKYGLFEIQTEVFNGILANELSMNHVLYFPAIYKGKRGVLCQSFIDPLQSSEELWEMRVLLCQYFKNLNSKMFGRNKEVLKEHTLSNISIIIDREFGPIHMKPFFEMVGFDALIGHGDRHWSNYGFKIGQSVNGNIKFSFAPIYDTAAGYLTEIPDNELEGYFNHQLKDTEWYRPTNGSLSKVTIEGRPKCNHFDLIDEIITNPDFSNQIQAVIRPIRSFNERLPKAILSKFFNKMDRIRQKIVIQILCMRYRMLQERLKDIM